MKMKELLSIVFLFSLIVSSVSVTSNVKAISIPEGAIIKTDNNPDVYIVKYKNGKQFKRLVLNPQVFESYGHLKWEDILTVDQAVINSFLTSDLVTVYGENDVYQLVPDGDNGSKFLAASGYDFDSVYTINDVDFRNYVLQQIKGISDDVSDLQDTVNQQEEVIQRQQEQIDDIETEISTPKVDYCNNIEGIQTYVPNGMYRENGNCFAIVIVPEPVSEPDLIPEPEPDPDKCNNIDGIQYHVPDNMHRTIWGECLEIPYQPTTMAFVKDLQGEKNNYSNIGILNDGPDTIIIKNLVFIDSEDNEINREERAIMMDWIMPTNKRGIIMAFTPPTISIEMKPGDAIRIFNDSRLSTQEISLFKALKYVHGSIIEVSTGNDVMFEDFNF